MAYNLRTGLMGSGDIDVNVSLSGLTADNILSGVFDSARIPTLSDSKISDLNAAKLTGTLSADRIASGSISDTKLVLGSGSIAKDRVNEGNAWAETEIPTLPKAKIDPDHNTQWAVADLPDSIPTSKLATFVEGDIPNLSAAKITSGVFASSDRIPMLPSSKIDPATTFAKSMINTANAWPVGDIPSLPAGKITTGTFAKSMITTGDGSQWAAADIPNLDAAKITTGTISSARLPATTSTSDYLMIRGFHAAYGSSSHTKSITTTYAALDSQTNGSFTAPASGMVIVTLTFYLICVHDKTVFARLVKGGTTTEFTSAYSLNTSGVTCRPTDNVSVLRHVTADSGDTFDKQVQVTWILTGLTSGSTYAIDAQVKTGNGTATCNYGDYGTVAYPPVLFEVRGLPNAVTSIDTKINGF